MNFDEKVVRAELWERCVDQRGLTRAGALVGFHCSREGHCRKWLLEEYECLWFLVDMILDFSRPWKAG